MKNKPHSKVHSTFFSFFLTDKEFPQKLWNTCVSKTKSYGNCLIISRKIFFIDHKVVIKHLISKAILSDKTTNSWGRGRWDKSRYALQLKCGLHTDKAQIANRQCIRHANLCCYDSRRITRFYYCADFQSNKWISNIEQTWDGRQEIKAEESFKNFFKTRVLR